MPRTLSSLAARDASYASWIKTADRSARTANGRAALEAKFLAEANGDPVRAELIRKRFYTRLALASVKARQVRKTAQANNSETGRR